MTVRQATPAHEAIYREITHEMEKLVKRHPQMRVLEIIAVLGRMAGYTIAACYPQERDLAFETLRQNAIDGCASAARPGPEGHA